MLGVIGGPLIFVSAIAVLLVMGFRPSPILADARFTGADGGSLRPAAAP